MYKIYKIIDNTNSNVYIGQTIQLLNQRLPHHRSTTRCSSRDIIKNGDYRIELIEETDDKMRERYWILNTDCVNKVIPGRTKIEWRKDNTEKIKEYKKEYYEDNKGHIANYHKEWREKNKERNKEYREKNKEKTKDYNKEYREKNKEKQKEYDKNKNKFFTSMGGRPDNNNMSLLKIDPDLFNQN